MKILHVLTSPRAEGTPRLVLDWLTVNDYEQYVLFLNSQPADLLPLFQSSTTNIWLDDVNSPSYIKKCRNIIYAVRRACRTCKPDLVISWNQGYSHWIVLGSRLAGVKKTIVHGGCEPYIENLRGRLYNYYVHWPLYLMNSKLICASKFIENRFKKIPLLPSSNIFSVYNCLQYQKFFFPADAQNKQHTTAIIVANLEPIKNHISLLQAWPLVLEKIPNAQLWIVGRGSLRAELENYCYHHHLEKNVVFWGERHDVPQLLWQARVFILPSLSEGFGTVLIEALSAGLRLVVSNLPVFREVLQDGKYGTLVDVSDIHLFAQKIVEAFAMPAYDETEWQQIRTYVQNFSPQHMVNQYIAIANK